MSRVLRDPRIRLLVVALIVILMLALSWHLVAMGLHGTAMMLGLCVSILAAVVLLLPGGLLGRAVWLPLPAPLQRPRGLRVEPLGRHPPDEGVLLRL
jgi:hypothetical protein